MSSLARTGPACAASFRRARCSALCTPGTGQWELFTNDISSGDFIEFPTAARVVIAGDNVTFFVPVSEFQDLSGVRLVTFGFDIDRPIDGSGSVDTSGVAGPDFGPDSLIVPPEGPPIFSNAPLVDTVVQRISPELTSPGATIDIELVELSLRGPSPSALPLVGDFDGDGSDDLAIFDQRMFVVFDPAQPGQAFPVSPGRVFDVPNLPPDALPTAGDTDGNGRDELGVFSPSSGDWQFFEIDTSGGLTLIDEFGSFGGKNDLPFVVDIDLDGRGDPGVYDPGTGLVIVGERTQAGVDSIFSAEIGALLAELGSLSTVDLGADGGQALIFRDGLGEWSSFDFESFAAVSIPSDGLTPTGALGVAGDFDGDGAPTRVEMIFADGFESGDTSAWSSTVP